MRTKVSVRCESGSSGRRHTISELFVKLLAQHGDDFKRISASMPNKVCVAALFETASADVAVDCSSVERILQGECSRVQSRQ